MADDEVTPLAGELTTTNYGWTKPTVGASVDAWGGYINTDLDGIDSTVHSIQTSVPAASTTTPAMDGTAAVGVGATFARADHVHPTDTSRAPLASPAFTGTPSMPTGTTGVTQTAGDSSTKLATTAFVGALPVAINDNKIINGDFRIDQRNNGASGTAIAYTVDRWQYYAGLAAKGTWGRNLNAVAGPAGFPYYLGFQSSSAYTLTTNDIFQFYQVFEGDAVSDFAWGTANAQAVTVSFWARSSLTGTFGAMIGNYAATRSYPFSYSIPAANTWTRIVVTIPGDTAGTWVLSGNNGAIWVVFDLGSGSAKRGPANVWASADYEGVTGAVSVVATLNATFYVTGVKLEIGSVATPFNRQSLAKSMADCQRYYQTGTLYVAGYTPGSYTVACSSLKPVSTRASSTMVITTNNSGGMGTITPGDSGTMFYASGPTTGAVAFNINVNFTANAEL